MRVLQLVPPRSEAGQQRPLAALQGNSAAPVAPLRVPPAEAEPGIEAGGGGIDLPSGAAGCGGPQPLGGELLLVARAGQTDAAGAAAAFLQVRHEDARDQMDWLTPAGFCAASGPAYVATWVPRQLTLWRWPCRSCPVLRHPLESLTNSTACPWPGRR